MPLKSLALSLQFGPIDHAATHRAALPRHCVTRWIRHALECDAEITVRIVDAAEGQALNRDYRHKDYATNVLTFDYAQAPVVNADLVLCAPVVARRRPWNRARPCRHITRTCWCTAPCTRRAGTTKPARRTPRPWKRARRKFSPGLGLMIPMRGDTLRLTDSGPARHGGAMRIGIVTGPSLTKCTFMSAPNRPVCTRPCAPRACATK